MDPSVCAVAADTSEALKAALAHQQRQPESFVEATGSVTAAVERGVASGADWLWVLDGTAAPRPGALLALLEALGRLDGLPSPVALAGAVLTPAGRVDAARSAWPRRWPVETAIAAVERQLFPIRAAVGAVLVERRAAEAVSPPRSRLVRSSALLEWTARVLRRRYGYLVPRSESVALTDEPDPSATVRTATALLAGGAFGPREGVRVAVEILADRRPLSGR